MSDDKAVTERDAIQSATAVAQLERAIANWELLAWYGKPADKARAKAELPALRARLAWARRRDAG